MRDKPPDRPVRLLLLGASVGKAWDLPDWPRRLHRSDVVMEMLAVYSFDKKAGLEEVLIRPRRKFRFTKKFLRSLLRPRLPQPDVVVIKECAAYFPRDLEKSRDEVESWIESCSDAGIETVPATVIPVTVEHAREKPGRQDGILRYNDWIRAYCRETGSFCLDLEKVLISNNGERLLREDLAAADGLHLNAEAYRLLDEYLRDSLDPLLTHYFDPGFQP